MYTKQDTVATTSLIQTLKNVTQNLAVNYISDTNNTGPKLRVD